MSKKVFLMIRSNYTHVTQIDIFLLINKRSALITYLIGNKYNFINLLHLFVKYLFYLIYAKNLKRRLSLLIKKNWRGKSREGRQEIPL